MAPPNPKRPPRPPRPPGKQAAPDESGELPFDDDEVAPLQADDPRPQRVPQFPAGPRKGRRRGSDRSSADRELSPRLDWHKEYSDPGHPPAFLYVERGPGAGQLVPVQQGSMTLGRSSSCDLRLQHPSISRRHAQLTRRGNAFTLRDLNSQNGTFLNRVRVTHEVELNPGDELSMGNAMLRLRGPGTTSSPGLPAVVAPSASSPPRKRRALGPMGVALLAAAVGSAVALLTLVAVTLAVEDAPSVIPAAPQAEVAATPSPAPASTAEAAEGKERRPGIFLTPVEEKPAGDADLDVDDTRAGPSAADVARGTARASPTTSSEAPEPRARPRASQDPGSRGHTDPALEADVRARYEAGNVAAARERARALKLTALYAQLTRFESADAEAHKALARRDVPGAIAALTTAVTLDYELSHGWSRHGPALRKQLAGMHVLAGTDAARGSRADEARGHFELALKHDPGNPEARERLSRLSAAAVP